MRSNGTGSRGPAKISTKPAIGGPPVQDLCPGLTKLLSDYSFKHGPVARPFDQHERLDPFQKVTWMQTQ